MVNANNDKKDFTKYILNTGLEFNNPVETRFVIFQKKSNYKI